MPHQYPNHITTVNQSHPQAPSQQMNQIGVIPTPNHQQVGPNSHHFFNSRQMTPVANQTFKIPIQNQQTIRSMNSINHPS